MEKTFYTVIVHSANVVGMLGQVAAVFTRRQVNIESLNVSPSSIPDVHKYIITCWCEPEQMEKIAKQLERKIDIIKANYYTDDELYIQEVALYKISTPVLLDNPEVSRCIRRHDARLLEVNPVYATVHYAAMTDDIIDLYHQLNGYKCILQYSRSGRIVTTRSTKEEVTEYMMEQDRHL